MHGEKEATGEGTVEDDANGEDVGAWFGEGVGGLDPEGEDLGGLYGDASAHPMVTGNTCPCEEGEEREGRSEGVPGATSGEDDDVLVMGFSVAGIRGSGAIAGFWVRRRSMVPVGHLRDLRAGPRQAPRVGRWTEFPLDGVAIDGLRDFRSHELTRRSPNKWIPPLPGVARMFLHAQRDD